MAAVRTLAGSTVFEFSDPTLVPGMLIRAVHMTELRAALTEARMNLLLTPVSYTNQNITPNMTVTAADGNDLRAGVR